MHVVVNDDWNRLRHDVEHAQRFVDLDRAEDQSIRPQGRKYQAAFCSGFDASVASLLLRRLLDLRKLGCTVPDTPATGGPYRRRFFLG
jgi:hypothetical protein